MIIQNEPAARTINNTDLDKSRAEFEAWAREEYGFGDAEFHAPYEGRYLWERTSDMWFAWRAARAGIAAPAAPTAKLIELCAEMVKLHAERGTVLTIHMDELARILAAPTAAVQPSDAARLDFMIEDQCVIDRSETGDGLRYWLSWPYLYSEQSEVFKTPRDAIDAQIADLAAAPPEQSDTIGRA